jgi:hypothetical protein
MGSWLAAPGNSTLPSGCHPHCYFLTNFLTSPTVAKA